MLFQYVGDETAPKTTTVYGYTFKLYGAPVEVTGQAIKKLKGNASFVEGDAIAVAPEAPAPVPEKVIGKTFDLPVEKEDLSELTEEELEKLSAPKKKKSK
jgi:hypothetical protein